MSRSSACRGATASAGNTSCLFPSASRAQTEPLAALAAVLVVGLALGLYADVLGVVEPGQSGSPTADATLQRVHDALAEDGIVVPERLARAAEVAPPGQELNVTLVANDRRWTTGQEPPTDAESASRLTPVRLDRWSASSGRLRVVVWS